MTCVRSTPACVYSHKAKGFTQGCAMSIWNIGLFIQGCFIGIIKLYIDLAAACMHAWIVCAFYNIHNLICMQCILLAIIINCR